MVELPDAAMAEMPMHNIIPRFSATPGALRHPAPDLGEHNAEILRGIGYEDAEIERLIEAGVLGSPVETVASSKTQPSL